MVSGAYFLFERKSGPHLVFLENNEASVFHRNALGGIPLPVILCSSSVGGAFRNSCSILKLAVMQAEISCLKKGGRGLVCMGWGLPAPRTITSHSFWWQPESMQLALGDIVWLCSWEAQ